MDQDLMELTYEKFKKLKLRENQVEIFSISGNHDLKKVSFIGNKPFSWVKFLEQFGIVNLDYGRSWLGMNAVVYGIPYIDHNVGLSEYLKNISLIRMLIISLCFILIILEQKIRMAEKLIQ